MSARLSVIGLLLLLAGCDGHLERLRIKEQPAMAQSTRRHTLHACGQDVVQTMRAVADLLNLVAVERGSMGGPAPEDSYEWGSSEARFVMALKRQSPGVWIVDLADWPTFAQSEISRRAETEIRHRLESACAR